MKMMYLLAVSAVLAIGLIGCTSFTHAAPTDATDVAAAEATFNAAAGIATVWAQSGHETASEAKIVEGLRVAVYSNLVAARTAVANGDSATAAAALNLAKQGIAALTGYITANGGGGTS